jgi:hypothetical protein
VHPLRLQAPRAAYAHKSPGQGDCTATAGWPGGRDGRKSIKSKIIDTTAADSLIVGNMPYLRWTASPARYVSNGRAGTPRRIPPGPVEARYALSELRRMPRMRTSPYTIPANFAVTEFSEVHARLSLVALCPLWIG